LGAKHDNSTSTVIREPALKEGMRFVSPKGRDFSKMEGVMEVQGDHAVFIIYHHAVFAHFLIDYLPFIAYMRDTMPQEMRFLFADAGQSSKRHLEELDAEFAKRVDWIQCSNSNIAKQCQNQMVRVRNGSLTVFHPVSSTRHMDLILRARRWIMQRHPPKPEVLNDPKQRTIVYYTRNHASAGHGRAMDLEQEQIMIQMIQQWMNQFNRPEKLVIFDGTQPLLRDQIDLFQSANVVIGAHGGGLANILFLLPSPTCQERPKVLEFVSNPLTPDVQAGSWARSYAHLYSSCPWVDYHHVFYVPPSTAEVTFLHLGEFAEALNALFDPH
jgi:hypothetical protein